MVQISGTTGADTLVGTGGDDILIPLGTSAAGQRDILRGLDGADTYDLRRAGTSGVYDFIIDDRGTDGAVDSIINVGPLVQSASLGYLAYATAIRVGDDLVIHTPFKPLRFRDPGAPSYDIKIKDHFGNGQVETMEAGGVTYNLSAGNTGTGVADLMAGNNRADSLSAGAGNDWMFGNAGRDTLDAGDGDDFVFGGRHGDTIRAGLGNDKVFGEHGNDRIWLGGGDDWAHGGDGIDRIRGGDGNDWIFGEGARDILRGEAGNDRLIGGEGNDILIGGRGGDTYAFAVGSTAPGWGHDVIRDKGSKAVLAADHDVIEIGGIYGPGGSGDIADALARMEIVRTGNDMVISLDGGSSTIRVANMFAKWSNATFIENLRLEAGYWTDKVFQIISADTGDRIGDDRGYANGYTGAAHEIIFGSASGEQFFGDGGINFIWTGDGADTLIYKENDPAWLLQTYGVGGGTAHDIVADFDIAMDRLDFTQIKSITSMADLTIGQDADGDATIFWDSGSIEIADIFIELRGVTQAEVTADLFLFA